MSFSNTTKAEIGGLAFFVGFFGLIWALLHVAYYFIKLIILLIMLVINLCRLAAAAVSPSPTPSPKA